MHKAVERGVTFFDTGKCTGRSPTRIGREAWNLSGESGDCTKFGWKHGEKGRTLALDG